MDAYLNIIMSQSFSVNDSSYLTKSDSTVFLKDASVFDDFFGTNPRDVFHFGIYDLQKNLLLYTQEPQVSQYSKIQYIYVDVDGNTFKYYYNRPVIDYIFNADKSMIIDVRSLLEKNNITSSSFCLLINPVTNVFTVPNKLLVKEVSNSKTEVKLIPNFEYINPNVKIQITHVNDKIKLNGEDSISIPAGIQYTFESQDMIDNLFFSKTNGGVEYSDGILFVNSDNKIVLDLTKQVIDGGSLWLCSKLAEQAANINITANVNQEDYNSSVELLSFNRGKFIVSQIHSECIKKLNSFNVVNFYYPTKEKYADQIDSIKQSLNLFSDADVFSFISSIYYGKTFNTVISTFSSDINIASQRAKLQQEKNINGIYSYILSYLNFNYDFVSDRETLEQNINRIVTETIRQFVATENTKHLTTEELRYAYEFLYHVFTMFISDAMNSVFDKFNFKFDAPLKNALYFDTGNLYPILNWRVDFENGIPVVVVKLYNELDSDISDKSICQNICNISIAPLFQNVILSKDVIRKTIRLTQPNFAMLGDAQQQVNSKKTPYFNKNTLPTNTTDVVVAKSNKMFNTDFSDFKNFVVFSSALLRIKVFENKMVRLAEMNASIAELNTADNSVTNSSELLSLNNEITELIASFDFYESYLYNTGKFVYNSVSEEFADSAFVTELEESATIYDKDNRDSLTNNTPEYIYDNPDNDDYLKFLGMVGHHFDNLYLYISNFAFYNKIGFENSGNTSDNILRYVLDSFGLSIPPCISGGADDSNIFEYYLNSGGDATLSNTVSLNEKTRIVWKRILMNLPVIYKSKGTEECIRYILSAYGIPDNLVVIKEFGGSNSDAVITSSYAKSETIYMPEFIGNNEEYVRIGSVPTGYELTDFKFSVNSSYYKNKNKTIIPLYQKYVPEEYALSYSFDISGSIMSSASVDTQTYSGQSFSFGLIKEVDQIGRIYFIAKNSNATSSLSGALHKFVSEPVSIFDDNIYHVSIQRKDSEYDVYENTSVNYEIKLTDITNVAEDEYTETFSFFLHPNADYMINSLPAAEFWGNKSFSSQSINPVTELSGTLVANNDSIGSFSGIPGISSVISDNFVAEKFVGTLDKMTYYSACDVGNSYRAKIFNYDCYSDGLTSSIVNNLIYRFSLDYPIDIVSASFSPSGYAIENFNRNNSYITTNMFGFSGSNYTSSFNTASCESVSESIFPHQTKQFNIQKLYFTSEVGPSRFENQKSNYYNLINDSQTLFPEQSSTRKSAENSFVDSSRMGIFLSPLQERNDDMLDSIGTGKIISSISLPINIYSDEYSDLKVIRDNYYSMPRNKVLFNELFAMYKLYVDKGLFDTIKQFLPARSKSYIGIVIEPTILERPKIKSHPLVVEDIKSFENADLHTISSVNSDVIAELDTEIDVNMENNISYVDNSFSGFSVIENVPDEYQNNIFCDSGRAVLAYDKGDYFSQIDNAVYSVYIKHETKSMASSFYNNSEEYTQSFHQYRKAFDKVVLIKTGSAAEHSIVTGSLSGSTTYTPFTMNYYNNLEFKLLVARKESYLVFGSLDNKMRTFVKSQQTSNTTIKDDTSTEVNTSPIINTSVGNILKQQK